MTDFSPLTDSLKSEIAGLYDRAAHLYDQVGIRQFTYYAARLIEHLDLPPHARALDIATGRGALLFALAEKIGPGGHVLGIDVAPAMIAHTTAEIAQRNLPHAEVSLMDADHLDFPAISFDVITCGFALHFLDYPRLLPRLHQILKPGGSLGTIHPYVPTDDPEHMARWQWLFTLTRECFPPDFVPPASWVSPNRLNTPERIEAALSEAGFRDIAVTRDETVLYFADFDDWWAWEWSQGSRFWLEGMSHEGLAKFKQVSSEHLAAMQTPHGIPMRVGALLAIAHP